MSVMLGLNPAGAADYALKHLEWKRFPEFRDHRQALCDALVAAQVDYLHACGRAGRYGRYRRGRVRRGRGSGVSAGCAAARLPAG